MDRGKNSEKMLGYGPKTSQSSGEWSATLLHLNLERFGLNSARNTYHYLRFKRLKKKIKRIVCKNELRPKITKGALGFEPRTSRSAVECSTTELHPLMNTTTHFLKVLIR